MSSFGIYLIGFIIFIVGVALGAYLLGAPPMWIAVGVIVLIGIGILSGVSRTRNPDPPSKEPPSSDRPSKEPPSRDRPSTPDEHV